MGIDKLGREREEWAERCKKSMAEATEARAARAYKYGPDHPRYRDKRFYAPWLYVTDHPGGERRTVRQCRARFHRRFHHE